MRRRSEPTTRLHWGNHRKTEGSICRDASGMVLLGLVIAMVILSALTMTMLVQTSTSGLGRVEESGAGQAYYLAESGYRYAARKIADGADIYTDLHDKTFSWGSLGRSFKIEAFPYFFENKNETGSGPETSIETLVSGGFHDGLSSPPSSGKLLAGNQTLTYTALSISNPNQVTFTISSPSPLPYLRTNDIIVPVATTKSVNQELKSGRSYLDFQTDSTTLFPPRNGVIRIYGNYYSYRRKIVSGSDPRLDNIQPLAGAPYPVTVMADTDISLHQYLTIRSTGHHGIAERKVDFYKPYSLPDSGEEKTLRDEFDDLANWDRTGSATYGEHATEGGRLKITSSGTVSGTDPASNTALIALKWADTPIDLAKARSFTGDFLNYDAQVSIEFADSPDPDQGYLPESPIPKYVAAGLSFRINSGGSGYGFSIIRGNNRNSAPFDGIDNNLIPGPAPEPDMEDRMAALLWELYEQPAGSFKWRWLAFKDLSRFAYSDSVESVGTWETPPTGGITPWGLAEAGTLPDSRSGRAWHTTAYMPGTTITNGILKSAEIPVCHARNATLTFWSYLNIDAGDTARVEVYDGVAWNTALSLSSGGGWTETSVDLSGYLDELAYNPPLQIRFVLNADASGNTGEGWYIDDLSIAGDYYFPRKDVATTLALRVREAALLDFSQIPTSSASAIEPGMLVVGQVSNATGIVSEPPMINSGDWSSFDTTGVIALESVSGTFDPAEAEEVWVVGTNTRFTYSAYSAKENLIRAYIGDNAGCGTTANSDPFDDTRGPLTNLSGGDLHWPPDPTNTWSAAEDVFTQIGWLGITTDTTAGIQRISTADEPNGIIRATRNTTGSSAEFTRPEIGLHGLGDGVLNIRYADFGLRAVVPSSVVNLPAVQQE